MFDLFDDSFDGQTGEEVREGYDTAQICKNGHVVNDCAGTMPEFNSPHCSQCGQETISTCPKCKTAIRGMYHSSGVIVGGGTRPAPPFCFQCGSPYPWTESRLSAAREYLRELDRLTENEKGVVSRSLDDLVRDTPNTPVAALRFKTMLAKVGSAAADGLKSILVDITVESAKRQIWP
jgi:hypothetical protein